MRRVAINGRWSLLLPDFRADRPEWPWHEAARFAAMAHHLETRPVTPHRQARRHVVYDIGTELGDHAAVFASWGCDVVLVEPNPRAWPCTHATFEANAILGRVAGWWWGYCGDRTDPGDPEHVRFGTGATWPACASGPCTAEHGMAHLNGRPDPHPTAPQPMVTIDDLAARLPAPTAITIDVEGAELLVLTGAAATLRVHRPLVWVSIHPGLIGGYGGSPAEVLAFMASLGYEATHLATDHEEHFQFLPVVGR